MNFQKAFIMFNIKVSNWLLINKNDKPKVILLKKRGKLSINCQYKQNEARSQNDSIQKFLGGGSDKFRSHSVKSIAADFTR